MAITHSPNDSEAALPSYTQDDGTPSAITERLKSASKLRSIHASLKQADEASERNRAKVQDLRDFKPPLDQKILNARGQGSRFNINFGEVSSIINEAESGYIDSFVSPEHLISIKLQRNIVEAEDKSTYERILSDEFTKMIRAWDDGLFSYLEMVDQFVTHGVAVGYFDDASSWQWRGGGLREFKFPRRTRATPGSFEITTCEDQRTPSELSALIKDEEAATAAGWNVNAVKLALSGCSDELYDQDSSEDLQEQSKANDNDESAGRVFNPIKVIHAWVKEHNGTVSFYISSASPLKKVGDDVDTDLEESFLYKSVGEYASVEEALHIFPFYTGTKGNLYTIRGLGYMVYAQGMASNLMQCAMLDSAKDSMSIKYRSPSEKAISQIPIVHAGPATLIPPSLQIVEDQKAPNLQQSAVPALDLLSAQINKKSVSSTMSSVFSDAPDRRSKFELTAALEHFNSLNSAAMLLFSRPWRSFITQCVKRAFDPVQNDNVSSGQMAKVMQQACIDRGVPPALFGQIDYHETKTGVPAGPGGKAARAAQYESAKELYPEMDDVGRKAFTRDRMIDLMGPEKGAEYLNLDVAPRETFDHQIARLENNDLREGADLEPSPSENGLIHLRIHIGDMSEVLELVESGELDLVEATKELYPLFVHASKTYELTVVPEQVLPELKQHKQSLQQIGEYLNNGLREIQKQERDAAQAGEGGSDESGEEGVDEAAVLELERKRMEMQYTAQAHLDKLRQSEESHAQKLAMERAKAEQDIAIKDAQSASSI